MKKIIFFIFGFFLLKSCADFQLVYKTNQTGFLIKNVTEITTEGDDSTEIYIKLKDKLGERGEYLKYRLEVNAEKREFAEVINKDATASKFSIEHSINYTFYNLLKNCVIAKKNIKTTNTYSAKSSGYSFGTDVSKKESVDQNIAKNINEFISSLNALPNTNTCIR